MVAMVTVVERVDWAVGLLLVRREQAVVQGQVENVDEGRKRHADAVSVYVCVVRADVARGPGGGTRLAVGAVDGTAGYPRTAKFLQFGGRFDSEREALARIHIPQLSERLCGAGLVLAACAVLLGKWRFGQVALSGDSAGCLARVVGVGELLPATVTGAGGLCGYFLRGCEVECAGEVRGGEMTI
jgi:hypothetical protein